MTDSRAIRNTEQPRVDLVCECEMAAANRSVPIYMRIVLASLIGGFIASLE